MNRRVPRQLPHQLLINVRSNSCESHRERLLSNFSLHPFVLGDQAFANVEAFVQGIKYPEGDDRRYDIFQSDPHKAKRFSRSPAPTVVEWHGRAIEYRSPEHYRLQSAAIFAKFDQNRQASDALLSTGSLPLKHNTGAPERFDTCLPAGVFTRILAEVRAVQFTELGFAGFPEPYEPQYIGPDVVAFARNQADFSVIYKQIDIAN